MWGIERARESWFIEVHTIEDFLHEMYGNFREKIKTNKKEIVLYHKDTANVVDHSFTGV